MDSEAQGLTTAVEAAVVVVDLEQVHQTYQEVSHIKLV